MSQHGPAPAQLSASTEKLSTASLRWGAQHGAGVALGAGLRWDPCTAGLRWRWERLRWAALALGCAGRWPALANLRWGCAGARLILRWAALCAELVLRWLALALACAGGNPALGLRWRWAEPVLARVSGQANLARLARKQHKQTNKQHNTTQTFRSQFWANPGRGPVGQSCTPGKIGLQLHTQLRWAALALGCAGGNPALGLRWR